MDGHAADQVAQVTQDQQAPDVGSVVPVGMGILSLDDTPPLLPRPEHEIGEPHGLSEF
jgi:hypothetical protein